MATYHCSSHNPSLISLLLEQIPVTWRLASATVICCCSLRSLKLHAKKIKHKKPPRIEWVFVDPNGQYLSCLLCKAFHMIHFLDEWNLCDANHQQPKRYARKRGHLHLIRTFIETPDAKQVSKIGITQFCSWSISPFSVGYACVIGIWWFYPIFTKYNESCIKHSFCITSIRSLGWP